MREPELKSDYVTSKERLRQLTEIQRWNEIAPLLDFHDKGDFFGSLRLVVAGYCPLHDLEKDSVQRRILDFYGEKVQEEFQIQEERRLLEGFQLACKYLFGCDWGDDPEGLEKRRLLREITDSSLLGSPTARSEILSNASRFNDVVFSQKIRERLKTMRKGPKKLPTENRLIISDFAQPPGTLTSSNKDLPGYSDRAVSFRFSSLRSLAVG